MPEKKHLHFQTEEIELNRVKNAKLIHFKDELGKPHRWAISYRRS